MQEEVGRCSSTKNGVQKEVSKIIPKVEKFVNDRLESEVLVRSSKEANSSHAVAANLSELELKIDPNDKMENNISFKQRYSLIKRLEMADDDEEPSVGTDRGPGVLKQVSKMNKQIEEVQHLLMVSKTYEITFSLIMPWNCCSCCS
ncbi:hypothetical protein Tco_1109383 [Tanacetum coccineum]